MRVLNATRRNTFLLRLFSFLLSYDSRSKLFEFAGGNNERVRRRIRVTEKITNNTIFFPFPLTPRQLSSLKSRPPPPNPLSNYTVFI